ncbi:hypothetical protein CHL67_01770 [Prosthecochloris sp. GSB1]|uniref:GIY-YIG nuclease family protein n=1 Tax=Prosthecochloris sp. GSB1 TaxID=281093 RepID=UPI000B8CCE26|nr:DUF123 domain-containing protein [Prosthecochloris sp. GSB1]ASQ89815.1 hypothetical protein CHL67_01770 [Prosthecochloris sp. GSB1]
MLIRCFGDGSRQGTYALLVALSGTIRLSFGKFRSGAQFLLDHEACLYIGSALGHGASATPLAHRLVRHATRSQGNPPHRIRKPMIETFTENGLARAGFKPPHAKKLHWHIDYLLDCRQAELFSVFAIRSPERLETVLSGHAASLDETVTIARGLGARDTRDGTHLFGVNDPEACIKKLENAIKLVCRPCK